MPTITRAIIKSYDSANHRASVQVAGSLAVWLDGIPVSVGIAPDDVIAARECAVLLYTDDNPTDAVVIAVHGAVPGAGRWRRIIDADADTYVHTELNADEDKVRINVAGTLRGLFQTVTPHIDLTGEVRVSGTLGLGGSSPSTGDVILATYTVTGTLGVDGVDMTVISDSGGSGSPNMRGVTGEARIAASNASSPSYVRGLEFRANHAGSGTVTDQDGCKAIVQGSGTATNRVAGNFEINPLTTTATQQNGVRSRMQRSGSGTVPSAQAFNSELTLSVALVTDFHHYAMGAITMFSGGAVTNHYGFYNPGLTVGTNRRPIWDAGVGAAIGDGHGNRLRSNTQFGSTTGAFGGGEGVIGIANAPTVPTTNPAGGGILYASAGALVWRGSGGTVTTIAPA